MKGIEPSSQPWQGRIITSILHLHGISGARAGRALLCTTTPESGADSPIRTDVDFRLVVTNHVQSTTMRYRHLYILPTKSIGAFYFTLTSFSNVITLYNAKISRSIGNTFEPLAKSDTPREGRFLCPTSRRDSDPQQLAWKARALPIELLLDKD